MKNAMPEVISTNDSVVVDGTERKIVKLNNAATTPPFVKTLEVVKNFFESYGALHRGAGPHATKTYKAVQESIATIREFFHVRADQTMLFTENTSSAINLLAKLLDLSSSDVVLTSCIEHTSNSLPWKYNTLAKVVEAKAFNDGAIDIDDLEKKAVDYAESMKLIAVTGASNQTGYMPDLARLSATAHRNDALLFVDAAQLAPHRPINMERDGIDVLAFSAHKIYAPFGLGVLILPTKLLDRTPINPGGGSIDMISETDIVWAPSAERHQTGTWNVTGIIALAESCRTLDRIGWDAIVDHERDLVRYAVEQLSAIPDLELRVSKKTFLAEDRIGTIPMTLAGYHHALLAAILEHEYAIETRAGTICNHRLVRRWFDVCNEKQHEIEEKIKNGNRLASYGILRASIGIHNTREDIDVLVSALRSIQKNGPKLKYIPVPNEETYVPVKN